MLKDTVKTLKKLHREGRDHIWAYYTRNVVRPVVLAHGKVDVVVGNPPWLNYNQTIDVMRSALEGQSKGIYGIWAGGRYATHQDVAGLFFARAAHLYLKENGVIGMVMPHSALQGGQYSKWRTGDWRSSNGLRTLGVDFTFRKGWDLERLQPNSFFPIPASVVFARRLDEVSMVRPLAGEIERWEGVAGTEGVSRVPASIKDASKGAVSPYAARARQGASIVPRRLFFVNEVENPTIIPAGQTVTLVPRLGSQDKKPWKELDLSAITDQTIEETHLFNVHLGETVVPYATLNPLKALLPMKHGETMLRIKIGEIGGIDPKSLGPLMRERWRTVDALWEVNKAAANRLHLLGRLDYHGELSVQLEWQRSQAGGAVRVVYTSAGVPTASLIQDDAAIIDYKLFWIACQDMTEAYYLLAIINSDALRDMALPLMSKGQFGGRDLQKHLWKLPIPVFDDSDLLHKAIADAGMTAEKGVEKVLQGLRSERKNLTVTVARRGDSGVAQVVA